MKIHKSLVSSIFCLSLSFVACNTPESKKSKDNSQSEESIKDEELPFPKDKTKASKDTGQSKDDKASTKDEEMSLPKASKETGQSEDPNNSHEDAFEREDESLSDEERTHVSIAPRDAESSFKKGLATYKSPCRFNDFYGRDGEWTYLIATLTDFGNGYFSLNNTFYANENCDGIYNSMTVYYSFPFLKSPFHAIENPHVIGSFVLEHPSQVYGIIRTNDDSYIEYVNEDENSFLIKDRCGSLESGKELCLKKDCLKDGSNEEGFITAGVREAKTLFKLGSLLSYDKDKNTVIITSKIPSEQTFLTMEELESHE